MREGKEDEEEGEEGVLRVAKTEGRNVAFLREVLAGEMQEHAPPLLHFFLVLPLFLLLR